MQPFFRFNRAIFVVMIGAVGCRDDADAKSDGGTFDDNTGASHGGDTNHQGGDTSHQGGRDTNRPNGSDDSPGWDGSEDGTVEVLDGGTVIEEEDGTITVCYKTVCDGRLLACGDCKDNDNDGRTDWRDQECLGPCDNTEGPALISDVGGVTGSTCHVDCYFDYGNGMGSGSDDCWWDHQCDPLEPEKAICEYNERLVSNNKFCPTEQSETCRDVCLPFTPNGCDCFGCCTFPELSGKGENNEDVYVWIGAKDESNAGTCTFEDILNPDKCPPCTPQGNCLNECGPCEICIGRPEPPEECFETDTEDTEDGTINEGQCPDGLTPCGLEGLAPCDPGYYCVSGCCKDTSIVI